MIKKVMAIRMTCLASCLVVCLFGFSAGLVSAATTEQDGGELMKAASQAMRATRYEQARALLDRAKARLDEAEDTVGLVHFRILKAKYLVATGAREDRAHIEILNDALAATKALAERRLEARVLEQLAQYLVSLGEIEIGWQRLSQARDIYTAQGDQRGINRADAFAALLASRQGDDRRAAALAAEVLPRVDPDQDADLRLSILSILGYSQMRLEQYAESLATYEQLIPAAWQEGNREQLNHAYCNAAEAKRHLGLIPEAESDLRRAIRALERAREKLPEAPQRRAEFINEQIAAYDRLAAMLVDQRRELEALALVDTLRGHLFFDHLEMAQALDGDSDDDTSDRTHGRPPLTPEQSDRTDQLRWGSRQQFQPMDSDAVATIQRLLQPHQAIVTYWVLEQRILAWSITVSAIEFTNIPVDRAQLEAELTAFVGPMRWPWLARDHVLTASESEHIASGRRLHRWLIESLPTSAMRATDWTVIADDLLTEVPWSALIEQCQANEPDPEVVHDRYRHCRYLVEARTLRHMPSLGVLRYLAERNKPSPGGLGGNLLLVSPTFDLAAGWPALPGADAEVEAIADASASRFDTVTSLRGSAATKSELRKHLRHSRVVHFATHGRVNERSPLSSALLMASTPNDEGMLRGHEIINLDLDADLVTLAACRTGGGRLKQTGARMDLSQAFVLAGADEVLVSLWVLEDEIGADVLTRFYTARGHGVPTAQALRQVQLKTLSRISQRRLATNEPRPTALAHPRFWSNFRLVGRPY